MGDRAVGTRVEGVLRVIAPVGEQLLDVDGGINEVAIQLLEDPGVGSRDVPPPLRDFGGKNDPCYPPLLVAGDAPLAVLILPLETIAVGQFPALRLGKAREGPQSARQRGPNDGRRFGWELIPHRVVERRRLAEAILLNGLVDQPRDGLAPGIEGRAGEVGHIAGRVQPHPPGRSTTEPSLAMANSSSSRLVSAKSRGDSLIRIPRT